MTTNETKQEKTLTMTVLMTPDMTNFSGVVHGGAMLKLLDQVAYACAARYCKQYVVTASLDHVFFRQKIKVGEMATFLANINYTGRTSMEVGIKVIAESLQTQEKRHVISSYFTMVAVNEQGQSIEVPPLQLHSEEERKLFRAAQVRKQFRKEIEEKNKALHVDISPETLG